MAFDTSSASHRPSQGEAPFGLEEVFYSRTDPRGVILSGNEVFRRVSHYDWDGLIGAPHKLIRHPDMPKGVFRLLWDRIKAGQPTGAYVKNRAQDGLPYWVYAVVTPVEGGYLSVRIKPSSPFFDTAHKEYAAILARERDEGLEPGASCDSLLERLAGRRHDDYDTFMAEALAAELLSPRRAAVRTPSPELVAVQPLVGQLRAMLEEKHHLLRTFEEIRAVPINLHITASRIEAYGGPVATLAENYRLMAAEITRRLELVVGTGTERGAGEQMLSTVAAALFRIGCRQVQDECIAISQNEAGDLPFDRNAESELLEGLSRSYARQAADSMCDVVRTATAMVETCEELKRHLLGLDSIRILCRVEAGRLQAKGQGLQAIIDQLDRFHADIDTRLDRIVEHSAAIRIAAEAIFKSGEGTPDTVAVQATSR